MSGAAVHFPLSGAIDGVPTPDDELGEAIEHVWDLAIAKGFYAASGAELAAIAGTTPQPNPDFPQNPPGIYPAVLVAYLQKDPQGRRCIIMNGQMPLTGMG